MSGQKWTPFVGQPVPKPELLALLEAARLAASAIRNLEGQPIQYSLAKDLSTALVKLEFCIERLERQQ